MMSQPPQQPAPPGQRIPRHTAINATDKHYFPSTSDSVTMTKRAPHPKIGLRGL
jgi:hypothetical protein